jgi:putative peptidoglycan lipid II flippase
MRYRFARGYRLIVTLMIPAAALYLGLAQPFVAVLLQRGAFDASATARVSHTLAGFAVGLPAFSVYLYTLRTFYSMQDTRTPFLLNCAENAANIVAALLLFPVLGIPGLSLAFAIAYLLAAVLTFVVVNRRLGGLRGRQIGSTIGRVTIVGAVIAGVTRLITEAFGTSNFLHAFAAATLGSAVGIAIFVFGLRLLRVHEVHDLRRAFGRGATREVSVSP